MKHRQKGQGLVEYALILVLVSITVIFLLTLLGDQVEDVFCKILEGLPNQTEECPDETGASMTFHRSDQVKYGRFSIEDPGSVEYALEKVDEFRDGAVEEEEALQELVVLMEETMFETLEAPIEFAQYADDTTLFEHLSSIRDAALAGDYEAVLALLTEPGGQGSSLPTEVRLKVAAKYTPRIIRACQVIDGKQVPHQDYVDAREAMVLLGELDRALLLDEAWEIIEPRNDFIDEIQPAFIQSAEASITFMLDSGYPEYVALAQRLQDDLAAFSGG